MGKLEEALRPVFDLLGFCFSQWFDPEMKPLSFLRAFHDPPRKRLLQGMKQGSLNPQVWLHLCLCFFSLSVSCFMCTCTSVGRTLANEVQIKAKLLRRSF